MKKKGTNRLKSHLEALQKHKDTHLTPDETLKRIYTKPATAWSCHNDIPKTMLRYQLYSHVHSAYTSKVKSSLNHSPFLDFEQLARNQVDVFHIPGTTRIEFEGKSLFGNNVAFISDEQNGALYLDKTDKTFLQMAPDQVLKHNIKSRAAATIENVCESEHEGKTVNLVEIQLTQPESLTIKLWCWDDKETSAFRQTVYQQVIGCTDKLKNCKFPIDELMKLGLPLKGETYITGQDKPVSEFFLQDLSLVKADAGLFAIPKGYKDIRDAKKHSKKHAYQKPVRASAIRPGHINKNHDTDFKNPATQPDQRQKNNDSFGSLTHNLSTIAAVNPHRLKPVCSCLESTYGSQVASEFEQLLPDDLKFLVNQISHRLSGFTGSNGNLSLDWLDQFKAFSEGLPQGDGLYCMLRDEPDPASADLEEQMGGKGLIDVQVERMVRSVLVDMVIGDITPFISPIGAWRINNQLVISNTLATNITSILSNSAIEPGDRFDELSTDDQVDLRERYLAQIVGSIELTYPESTGTQSVFHNLLSFRVDNIEFDIRIDNTDIIDTFTLGNNDIHLLLKLPNASGSAFTTRWPSTLYWAALALGIVGCFFSPFLCSLLPLVATVGTFLLFDAAFVSIEFSDIDVDMHVDFVPDANGVLQPNTTFNLDMDVSLFYLSVIPTGIHQILSAIYSIVGSHTDLILNLMESQLSSQFNNFVKNDLKLTYPPQFGPVPLVGLSSIVNGVDEEHLYMEAELNAGLLGIISPYITQVDTNINQQLLEYRDEFQSSSETSSLRHYKGFVLSQNFINHYIHILWRQGMYNYVLSNDQSQAIIEKIKDMIPDLEIDNEMHVHICPVVSPRLVLTPCGIESKSTYMTCFFDDLRLCIGTKESKDESCILEIQLAAKVTAELGFGGLNKETGKLDIIKITDRFMDIYFDQSDIAVSLIHPETQGYATLGKCFKNIDCRYLEVMQPILEETVRWMLKSRDSAVIPRDTDDTLLEQTYSFSGQYFKFVFWVKRGNIYAHVGFGGAVQQLLEDGAFSIDDMNCATGEALLELIDSFGG